MTTMSEYPRWQPPTPGRADYCVRDGGYSEGHTPTHGGTVTTGYEFDLIPKLAVTSDDDDDEFVVVPIPPTTTTTTFSTTTTTPQLRTPTSLSPDPSRSPSPSRSSTPRPLSMPQAYVQQSTSTSSAMPPAAPAVQPDPSRESRQAPDNYQNGSRSHREHRSGRSSTRIIGNYTMTKTLGAGSMGKVKLATHNNTGEKVILISISPLSISSNLPLQPLSCSNSQISSLLSKSSLVQAAVATPPTRPLHPFLQNKHRRMPRRKSAPSARLPFRCSSSTRTSVACASSSSSPPTTTWSSNS